MNGMAKYLENAIGPGTLKIKRVQLWDIYSRRPIYLDANLAGQEWRLFDYKVGDVIAAINAVALSPAYRAGQADTNLDSAGNSPYDLVVHGLSMDYQVNQYIPGTVGAVNDLAFWPAGKQALLQETFATLSLNDTDVDKLTAIDAPGAGGVAGFAAMGTSAALTVGASMSGVSNGLPQASNYRDYLQEGPFFIEQNSTILAKGTWGPSALTANMGYKPAATAAPTVFLRMTLKGMRIWNI